MVGLNAQADLNLVLACRGTFDVVAQDDCFRDFFHPICAVGGFAVAT